MFSVSCGSVLLSIPFTCGHTRARDFPAVLPVFLPLSSTPLLSSMTSPDAVAGATAVRDASLAMPASASAEAAESEVLISDPEPIEIPRAQYLHAVDTCQRSLLVRLPDVELCGRGLLELLAEQTQEEEQRTVPWESVVTKEFEDDAHRTKPPDQRRPRHPRASHAYGCCGPRALHVPLLLSGATARLVAAPVTPSHCLGTSLDSANRQIVDLKRQLAA